MCYHKTPIRQRDNCLVITVVVVTGSDFGNSAYSQPVCTINVMSSNFNFVAIATTLTADDVM